MVDCSDPLEDFKEWIAIGLASGGGSARSASKALSFLSDPSLRDILDALGLKPGAGQRSVQTVYALDLRDAEIRLMAGFVSRESLTASAREIHMYWSRYAETAWRRESDLETAPDEYRGSIRAHCWRALHIWPDVPKPRTIREILAKPLAVKPPLLPANPHT